MMASEKQDDGPLMRNNNERNPQNEPTSNSTTKKLAVFMGEAFAQQFQQAPEQVLNPWQSMFDAFAATQNATTGMFEFARGKTVNGENLYQWLERQTLYHVPARVRKFEAIGFDLDTFDKLNLLSASSTQQQQLQQQSAMNSSSNGDSQSQLTHKNSDNSAEPSEDDDDDDGDYLDESIRETCDISSTKPADKPIQSNKGRPVGNVYQIDPSTSKTIHVFKGYREAARQFESEPSKIHSHSVQISSIAGKQKLCRHGFFWKVEKTKKAGTVQSKSSSHRRPSLDKTKHSCPETEQPAASLSQKMQQCNRDWEAKFNQLKNIKEHLVGEFRLDKKTDLYRWLLEQDFLYRLRETGAVDALSDERLQRFNSLGFFLEAPPTIFATTPVARSVDECDEMSVSTSPGKVDDADDKSQDASLPAKQIHDDSDLQGGDDALDNMMQTDSPAKKLSVKDDFQPPSWLPQLVATVVEELSVTATLPSIDPDHVVDQCAIPHPDSLIFPVEDKVVKMAESILDNCGIPVPSSMPAKATVYDISDAANSTVDTCSSPDNDTTTEKAVENKSIETAGSEDGNNPSGSNLPEVCIGQDLAVDPEGDENRPDNACGAVSGSDSDSKTPVDCLGKEMIVRALLVSALSPDVSRTLQGAATASPSPEGALTIAVPPSIDATVTGDSSELHDHVRLPILDAMFWVLPESRQNGYCRAYRTDGCCPHGHHCRFIHIQCPWGDDRLNQLWSACDKQLPSTFSDEPFDRIVSCHSATVNGTKWYTARYSTEHHSYNRRDRKVIFAEGGPTARQSEQGVHWYPSEDDALTALKKAVIVTYWATTKDVSATPNSMRIVSECLSEVDLKRQLRQEDEPVSNLETRSPSSMRRDSLLHDKPVGAVAMHLTQKVGDASQSPLLGHKRLFTDELEPHNNSLQRQEAGSPRISPDEHRSSNDNPPKQHNRSDTDQRPMDVHDLPEKDRDWIRPRNQRFTRDCTYFTWHNWCKHESKCFNFHYFNPTIALPRPLLGKIRVTYFPGTHLDIQSRYILFLEQGKGKRLYVTAGYRYRNFALFAEGGNGVQQKNGGQWWYATKEDAKEALSVCIRKFHRGPLPRSPAISISESESPEQRRKRLTPDGYESRCPHHSADEDSPRIWDKPSAKRHKPDTFPCGLPDSKSDSIHWRGDKGGKEDCQHFARHNWCKNRVDCRQVHVFNPLVPLSHRSECEIKEMYFPGTRAEIESNYQYNEWPGKDGHMFVAAGYRFRNFAIVAQGGHGRQNYRSGVWWYETKEDAKSALFEQIRRFL